MNRYVEFVSDKDFLVCVKHVIDFYLSEEHLKTPTTVLKENKNNF